MAKLTIKEPIFGLHGEVGYIERYATKLETIKHYYQLGIKFLRQIINNLKGI